MKFLEDPTNNSSIRFHQLRPDHIGLPLCGSKGGLGGIQGKLQLTILLSRLGITVGRHVLLMMKMPSIVAVVGVGGVGRGARCRLGVLSAGPVEPRTSQLG